MEFLLRDDSGLSEELWARIDETVVKTARQLLTGRKFLSIYGPLGPGVQSVEIDTPEISGPAEADFFGDSEEGGPVKAKGRRFVEIPLIYKDFVLSWRDIEKGKQLGLPLDLSAAAAAAAECAKKEDQLIFLGAGDAGYEGLLNAKGVESVKKGDWQEGENALADVAKGLEALTAKGFAGRFALVVGTQLYMQLHRIQPGTGLMEIDRVKKLLDGNLFQTPVIGANRAVLLCAEPSSVDLVIGQDMITAYLGADKLNHPLRVLETVLPRIKRKDAIIAFK